MIYDPKLPIKDGYVEVEINGERVYQKIPNQTEDDLILLKEENKILSAQLAAQTDRADFLEDCVAEMASAVYETL